MASSAPRFRIEKRLDDRELTLVRGPPSVGEAFTPPFIEELFRWIDRAEAVFAPADRQRRDVESSL
jgi:hypothetical protein